MDLDRSATLESQLGILVVIGRAIRIDTIAGISACIISLALAAFVNAHVIVWGLVGAPAVMTMGLWIASQQLVRRPPPITAVRRWENYFVVLNLLAGLSWGGLIAYASFLDTNPLFVYAVVGLVVVLTYMKLAAFAGLHLVSGVFIACALIPAFVSISRNLSSADLFASFLAALMVAVVFISSRMIGFIANTGVSAKAKNNELQSLLDQRRTQVEKLNVALKTNEDKRQEVEGNLRRSAADLGLAEGKAKALATTLERVSPLDQVTGLANRRHFDANLDTEWRRAMREGSSVSIILVGLDEFEAFVETNGLQSADTLLKRVGQSIKGFGRRAGDMAGRYDETTLALLLPRCDVRNTLRMAEALRKRVEASKISHAGAKNRLLVTAHIAVATTKPGRGLPSDELLSRADTALYEAKFQGGNKVVSYRPLNKLKLEKWDKKSDGQLTEQSLMQKLLVWGYDTTQASLNESDPAKEHSSENDTVLAALRGEILLELEGHTMAFSAGDSVFVPKNVVVSLKVKSKQSATIFTATRSA